MQYPTIDDKKKNILLKVRNHMKNKHLPSQAKET